MTHPPNNISDSTSLGYPDFNREFLLGTGASFQELGAMLFQHVTAFASQSLPPSERSVFNCSSAKLELLALK